MQRGLRWRGRRAAVLLFVGLGSSFSANPNAAVQAAQDADQALPVVVVRADNTVIDRSCRVTIAVEVIEDSDGDGVIHVRGDGLTVDLGDAVLRGSVDETPPDEMKGVGVTIEGDGVALRGGTITGYRVGVEAIETNGLTLAEIRFDDLWRQRLLSTPQAEVSSDWLWSHDNDEGQWVDRYGAAIHVKDAEGVEIRDVVVRRGQNGIALDRVTDARIYDNDASFLSGWGLAMWRSNDNVVSRNSFDFCIRGYSHGVYNRGQDSAGILMFEQCSNNVIALNSITHGGDGIFAFAGREALGEGVAVNAESGDEPDYSPWERRGNNGNIFVGNDCSYAAAHGLELTFSFDNRVLANRFVGNAICGIWGGYSQHTLIRRNEFRENGDAGYGLERGGVNIEHGYQNVIRQNQFTDNRCGVHLWRDADAAIRALPWAHANYRGCSDNVIMENTFRGDLVGVHLRDTRGVNSVVGNTFINVSDEVRREGDSPVASAVPSKLFEAMPVDQLREGLPGRREAVGARAHLSGRDHIIMTEWGPYDWEDPIVIWSEWDDEDGATWLEARLIQFDGVAYGLTASDGRGREMNRDEMREAAVQSHGETTIGPLRLATDTDAAGLIIHRVRSDEAGPVRLAIEWIDSQGRRHREERSAIRADWTVRQFESPVDPRDDVERWRQAGAAEPSRSMAALRLQYGMSGPTLADGRTVADRFGTIAETSVELPAGRYVLRTTSDDGIRVWIDDKLVIDDWTWHAPREQSAEFTIKESRIVSIRIEHFELDGYAVLQATVAPQR